MEYKLNHLHNYIQSNKIIDLTDASKVPTPIFFFGTHFFFWHPFFFFGTQTDFLMEKNPNFGTQISNKKAPIFFSGTHFWHPFLKMGAKKWVPKKKMGAGPWEGILVTTVYWDKRFHFVGIDVGIFGNIAWLPPPLVYGWAFKMT